MQIEYRANRSRRVVSDAIGAELVARNIAAEVIETRELKAVEVTTPKPKRQYKRRDMRAEG